MECFACGAHIFNVSKPCPQCGYIFDADEVSGCPNKNGNVCELIEGECSFTGASYLLCPIKNRADEEDYDLY